MNSKLLTPKQIRKEIISQIHRFSELAKEIPVISPVDYKLKHIISSTTLLRIRKKVFILCGSWGDKYEKIKTMLKETERLRKYYVNLIFRTGWIKDPKIQEKLDEIPLALGEIIKEYRDKNRNNDKSN